MKYSLIILSILFCVDLSAQQVWQTFKDTRVINSHSVETLQKGKLDFRVTHRFGDLAGDGGGWPTFYGLENAADVLTGLEYGLTNNLMVGLSRTKGAGSLRQNINSFLKFRVLREERNGNSPFSMSFVGTNSISTMPKSENPGALNFFEKSLHRFTYNLQVILAKKISNRISVQGTAAWTYRNIVPATDQNDLVSLGIAGKFQVSKVFALIVDGVFPLSGSRRPEFDFYPPLGIGFEWETGGGHVFQLNVTNARGIVETDFIPYTKTNWSDGEFRLGFTISRLFTIK